MVSQPYHVLRLKMRSEDLATASVCCEKAAHIYGWARQSHIIQHEYSTVVLCLAMGSSWEGMAVVYM
jgi:hypothetical protein